MSYDSNIIEEYIIKTAQDDMDAFEKLYNETKKIVFSYVLSIEKDYFSAQDIMQDTFIKIKCNAKKYNPQGNPLGWILKIAKNETLMHFRRSKNETVITDEENDKILNISVNPDFDNRIVLENALKILNQNHPLNGWYAPALEGQTTGYLLRGIEKSANRRFFSGCC